MIRQKLRGLRRQCGRAVQSWAYRFGVMQQSVRLLGSGGAVILMYHSVADDPQSQWIDPRNHLSPEIFRQQLEFLSRHRTVISLGQLIDRLKNGEPPKPGSTVITFDDGYFDNLTIAAPMLRQYGFPATLFLPTTYIDRAQPQWIDQTYSLFKHRQRSTLRWTTTQGSRQFQLDLPNEFNSAYALVCSQLMVARLSERDQMIMELQQQLGSSDEMPNLTMNWTDVKRFIQDFPDFEIGGHTMGHLAMTALGEQEAVQELAGCRQRITEQTGVSPRHFSFPYGRTNRGLQAMVIEAGFESSCGGGKNGVVRASTPLSAFPRIEPPQSMERFDLLTSGCNAGYWHRMGR